RCLRVPRPPGRPAAHIAPLTTVGQHGPTAGLGERETAAQRCRLPRQGRRRAADFRVPDDQVAFAPVPREFLFTSESVTEGHPDKVADQISDTVLDAVLADDPAGRGACETLITTGPVVVAGEIASGACVDVPARVRQKRGEDG